MRTVQIDPANPETWVVGDIVTVTRGGTTVSGPLVWNPVSERLSIAWLGLHLGLWGPGSAWVVQSVTREVADIEEPPNLYAIVRLTDGRGAARMHPRGHIPEVDRVWRVRRISTWYTWDEIKNLVQEVIFEGMTE